MYKRGLSGIVATVLIVLLAVAAVAIIWNFIRPVLGDEENSEQIKLLTIRFSVLPQAVKIDDSLNLIALSVKREIGGGNIDGYNVVLEDDSKRTYSYKVPLQIKELEVQRLNIDYSGVVISIPKRIFIVPYIKSLKGRDIVGYDAGSYNVQASDLVAQTTCSTNGDCISFECKTATCNINTGCLYSSANQGGSCNNGAGTCNNGVCVSSGVGCV
ncbi:MAG: archaellin/type IV pilin N-terminal domain-containing protein, partial [Nanoarchaeota archaeon]